MSHVRQTLQSILQRYDLNNLSEEDSIQIVNKILNNLVNVNNLFLCANCETYNEYHDSKKNLENELICFDCFMDDED